MTQKSADHIRTQVLGRAGAPLIANLLMAVGNFPALLYGGMGMAVRVVDADRAIASDGAGLTVSQGFSPEEAERIVTGPAGIGPEAGQSSIRYYRDSFFEAPAEHEAHVLGILGVLRAPGCAFLLATGRRRVPFAPIELRLAAELIRLIDPAFQATALALPGTARTLTATDLPLKRLHPFPQFEEVQCLLIQEAMSRARNNKTVAAASLGITREGLRKMMIRLGMLLGERDAVTNGHSGCNESFFTDAG